MSPMINVTTVLTGLLLVFMLAKTTQSQGQFGKECKTGLCPYIKKLVPDLTSYPALSHYNPHLHGYEPPSLCGNLCSGDKHCPDHQKCCPTNCGYACFDAVHVAEAPAKYVTPTDPHHHYHH